MKRRTQKHLTEEECEDLKNACQTFSDQLIVYGLLYTGMRVDELCHMHPGWINLKDGTITIPREENGCHPKIVKLVDPGFEKMWEAGLLEYDIKKGLEWEWQAIDGAMTKAPLGGAGT